MYYQHWPVSGCCSQTTKPTVRPGHPRNLIRVFADRMCLLQPQGYPKSDKREPLPYWVDAQVDLSLRWSHRFYCRFCRSLITKTCPYNFDPLKPHCCIVKLGFTGVYIIFLISAQNIDCGYSYPQSMFWAEIWKISDFLSENFHFFFFFW